MFQKLISDNNATKLLLLFFFVMIFFIIVCYNQAIFGKTFYIESISTDAGKNIFVNDDFDAIMKTCKRALRDYFKYPVNADVTSFASLILGQAMESSYGPTVLKCLYYTDFNKFRVITNNGSCLCSYQGSSINDIDLRPDNSAESNIEAYSTIKKR